MDRRTFVTAGGLAAAGAARAQAGRVTVPMEVGWPPCWSAMTSSLTGCLNALGVDADPIDVAGRTGLAFILSISPDVSVHGPYAYPFGLLTAGVHMLGRSIETFCGGPYGEMPESLPQHEHLRELVRREIDAGRPCIVMGAGVPEPGIVWGYSGDKYLIKAWDPAGMEADYTALEAYDHWFCGFPLEVTGTIEHLDQRSVAQAIWLLECRSLEPGFTSGVEAYTTWIAAMEDGTADGFGHAFCLHNFAGCRDRGAQFLHRLSLRCGEVAEPLDVASKAFAQAHESLRGAAALFPFPGNGEQNDPDRRHRAAEAFATARQAELDAVDALREAMDSEWAGPIRV